jgi:hypothetical protein
MDYREEWFKVEFFGNIKPEHSSVLNHHLFEQLKEFDKLYAQANGPKIGSPRHQFERQEFARIVCAALIDYSGKAPPTRIREFETETKYLCKFINQEFAIKTQRTYTYNDDKDSTFQFSLN